LPLAAQVTDTSRLSPRILVLHEYSTGGSLGRIHKPEVIHYDHFETLGIQGAGSSTISAGGVRRLIPTTDYSIQYLQ